MGAMGGGRKWIGRGTFTRNAKEGKFFLDRMKNTKQGHVRKMSIEELRKSAFQSLYDRLNAVAPSIVFTLRSGTSLFG